MVKIFINILVLDHLNGKEPVELESKIYVGEVPFQYILVHYTTGVSRRFLASC